MKGLEYIGRKVLCLVRALRFENAARGHEGKATTALGGGDRPAVHVLHASNTGRSAPRIAHCEPQGHQRFQV